MSATLKLVIFLSYAGEDAFEASLLQFAVEHILAPLGATVWTYQRDQPRDESDIAGGLKARVRQSDALFSYCRHRHWIPAKCSGWSWLMPMRLISRSSSCCIV